MSYFIRLPAMCISCSLHLLSEAFLSCVHVVFHVCVLVASRSGETPDPELVAALKQAMNRQMSERSSGGVKAFALLAVL